MKQRSLHYFLISLLFLAMTLCLWIYFISFVHHLDASTRSLQTKTAEVYAQKNGLAATAELATSIATSTDALYTLFASSADVARVVEAVENEGKADSVSVHIQSITTASSSDPALLALTMDINATGSWGNLVAFAGNVERLPYALSLTKASFFQDGGSGSLAWNFDGQITSFLSP
ncbi:MAG TPA: hypothetical protein VMR73_00870 [Candidatus Paceibacterota bacterium]|nr:hypothetical protein [Candidatus Paceibacterota bacterium]